MRTFKSFSLHVTMYMSYTVFMSSDREGILTSITKTLQKRVGNVDPRETEEENLEYSMKKVTQYMI